MDEAELKRLEALCEAATPGPWEAGDFDCVGPGDGPKEESLMANLYRGKAGRVYLNASCVTGSCSLFNDADFIAAARTALPAALAEVRRLRGLVKAAERVEHPRSPFCPWCEATGAHAADCPAFMPDGTVR